MQAFKTSKIFYSVNPNITMFCFLQTRRQIIRPILGGAYKTPGKPTIGKTRS